MGAIAYPLARVLNNYAIGMIGVARAAPVVSLQSIFVLGLGMVFLGERPNLLVSIGTLTVVCGLVMVFLTQGNTNSADDLPSKKNLGFLLAGAGALAFASRDVISRHVVTGVADPLVTAAFALALGSGMLLIVIHRDVVRSLRRLPGRYIAICVLAGICTGLAVASLFQALSRAPVTVVSPISASSPLFALLLAHLFLQRLESISLMLVLGTFLSVGGVVLVVLGGSAS
jgi:drug/metabolite transporter (DMT)-like permease